MPGTCHKEKTCRQSAQKGEAHVRKKKKWLLVAGMMGILVVGAVSGLAYETDRGGSRNSFTTAEIDISLVERAWDQLPDADRDGVPDAAEDLHQGQSVTKDPAVKNDSTIPVYAFLRVRIPTRDVMLVDSAPQITQDAPLFFFTPKSGWKELSSSSGDGYVETWYGYTSRLDVGKTTGTLFDSITSAEVVEGQIADDAVLDITVDAYGIQANTFLSMDHAFAAFDPDQAAMTKEVEGNGE